MQYLAIYLYNNRFNQAYTHLILLINPMLAKLLDLITGANEL